MNGLKKTSKDKSKILQALERKLQLKEVNHTKKTQGINKLRLGNKNERGPSQKQNDMNQQTLLNENS